MHPPLKWVGGKKRLLPEIQRLLPATFDAYYEPFLGAGAVFLSVSTIRKAHKWVLSDINPDLMCLWQNLYTNVQVIIEETEQITGAYNAKLNLKEQEDYYHARRNELTQCTGPRRAAVFAFLNKAAFNGLVRYNKAGRFNAAFGKHEKIKIDFQNWTAIHEHLKNLDISFLVSDFEPVIDKCSKDDLLYLDPPYLSIGKRAIDNRTYHPTVFEHERLIKSMHIAHDKGAKLMLSNHAVDWLLNILPEPSFHHFFCQCKKVFSGKSSSRQATREVIVTNF